MNGLINGFEIVKELDCKFFIFSLIVVFGENFLKNMIF